MSQRDLAAELRGARPAAPADVRERVRLIAASAPAEPQRRLTARRALVVVLPVAAALAAAVVFTTRPTHRAAAPAASDHAAVFKSTAQGRSTFAPSLNAGAPAQSGAATKLAPQPSSGRAQRYEAYLALRVRTAVGVSDGVKRALRVASSLGGYPTSVHASSKTAAATADLTLKVPRANVQTAIERLSALGTITSESVDVEDAQTALNLTDRTLARLQKRLRALRAEQRTPAIEQQIATLTTRVERLQRARASTVRETHYATIQLHLQTKEAAAPAKHGQGPLHGLGVVFRWVGIVAVYALALGAPAVVLLVLGWLALRTMRRRREDALLSSP